jgi:hypothetical protein
MVRYISALSLLIIAFMGCRQEVATNAPKVKACFTIHPDSPTDVNCGFDASCSQNEDQDSWFLDNEKKEFDHYKYPSGISGLAGKHSVLLIASNAASKDTFRKFFFVTPTKPKACFSSVSPFINDVYFPVNDSVTFDAGCSYNTGHAKDEWLFPDGTNITKAYGRFAGYKWPKTGHYNVKLTVYNPSQTISDDTTIQINIH